MKWFILGMMTAIAIGACGWGSPSPDYNKFPDRSNDNSIWAKCPDNYEQLCQWVCVKGDKKKAYDRKNKCKGGHKKIVRIDMKKSLDAEYQCISKSFLMKLLRRK